MSKNQLATAPSSASLLSLMTFTHQMFFFLLMLMVMRSASATECGGGHFQDGLCNGKPCKCYQPENKTAVVIQTSTTSNVDTELLRAGIVQAAKEARMEKQVRYVNVRGDGAAAIAELNAATEDIIILETTHFTAANMNALKASPKKSSTYAIGPLNAEIAEHVIAMVGSNSTKLGSTAIEALDPPPGAHVICVTRLATNNAFYDEVCAGVEGVLASSGRTYQRASIDAFASTATADADFMTMFNSIPSGADRNQLYFIAVEDLVTKALLHQTIYTSPPTIAVVRPGPIEVGAFNNPTNGGGSSANWVKVLVDDSAYSHGYSVFHTAAFYHRTANVMVTNQFEFGPYTYTKRSELPPRWWCALQARDYVMCGSGGSDEGTSTSLPDGCSCINRTQTSRIALNWVTDPDSIQFFINTRYGLQQWWDALQPNPPALDERWPVAFDEKDILDLLHQQTMLKPDGLLLMVFSANAAYALHQWLPNVTFTNTFISRVPEFGAHNHSGSHFGTSEFEGGLRLGELIRAQGATKVACSLHIANWRDGLIRCSGVAAAFPPGAVVNVRTTHASSPGVLKQQVQDILDNDTTINGWVALDADNTAVIADAFTERGVRYPLAGFDWSSRLAEKIDEGTATAAASQLNVAYMYMSSMYLTLSTVTHQRLMNDWVQSGPKIITKENMAPFLCEDLGYPLCDKPILNNTVVDLVTKTITSESDHLVVIVVLVVVVCLIILGLTIMFFVSMCRKPRGINNAPLNSSEPFFVVCADTTAPNHVLESAAASSCTYLLRASMNSTSVFVTAEVQNALQLITDLESQLNQTATKIVVSISYGRGTIVPPARRSDEPRYSGRVVDTALELMDISNQMDDETIAYNHGVILTIGEVAALYREASGFSNSVSNHPLQLDVVPSAAAAADQTTDEEGMSTSQGPQFRDVGDRKFKGGIIRRLMSIQVGSIPHPTPKDVQAAAERLMMDASASQNSFHSTSVADLDHYGPASTTTVTRRGSIMQVDCTAATSAVELFDLHNALEHVVEQFGGDLECVSGMHATATFGVHRVNVLHEQNACRAAFKLHEAIPDATISIAAGKMTSCTNLHSAADGTNKRVQKATGDAVCIASAIATLTASQSGPGRIFVQQDIIHATGISSLPHDTISIIDQHKPSEELTHFTICELFYGGNGPFVDSNDVTAYRDGFERLRIGQYGAALQRLHALPRNNPYAMKLTNRAQNLVETFGNVHEKGGYKRTAVCPFPRRQVPTDSFVLSSTTSFARSSTVGVVVGRSPRDHDQVASQSFGTSHTSVHNASMGASASAIAKESLLERSRRRRDEVTENLKSRSNLLAVDDGLISMFVSEPVAEEVESIDLPTELVDVNGNPWYRSLAQANSGSFATVYRAVSKQGRVVSLKCFDTESSTVSTISAEEIANEVSLLSSYSHENIIGYITYGFIDRYCFIVMEHAAGGSLYGALREFGTLTCETVRNYMRDALRGLEYLHSQNIVHCDIKPHNILIGSDGVCKIADFGSTVDLGFAESQNTAEKVLARGTPAYMSPEACRGAETPAGDMWGIGISMVELLTGSVPWDRKELRDLNKFIAKLGSSEDMVPAVPAEVCGDARDFVESCLQRDPNKRPTASEALHHLFFH